MVPEDQSAINNMKTEKTFEENVKTALTLEVLDNEPGFYQSTMRSMLLPGHEGELCTYLKEMGLIQRSVRCQGSETLPNCSSPMKWTQARIVDKYTWKCTECKNKCSIREDSFFKQTKCSLMATIRILLGWCKDMDAQDISTILNLKVRMVEKLYLTCSQMIENYLQLKPNDFKLGGAGTIVLVDVYPEGCAKLNGFSPEFLNNNSIPILCLAEAKNIPTQYWLHAISSQDRLSANKEVIDVIKSIVQPGTVLVTDSNSKLCVYEDLCELKEFSIVTVEGLKRHNTPNCTIFQTLDTIWDPAVEICNEAQKYSQPQVQLFLYNQLWRRKFGKTPSSALEYFLHLIADRYPLIGD